VDHTIIQKMDEHYELFFWIGIFLWALGHQGRISQKKKAKPTDGL